MSWLSHFYAHIASLLAARPQARVVIVGGEKVSYGKLPDGYPNWKAAMLAELGGQIDMSRIHFVGNIPYRTFLALLQVSAVHVYLTYPFVLSWSLLEAMSAGCLIVASNTPPVAEVIAITRPDIWSIFLIPMHCAHKSLQHYLIRYAGANTASTSPYICNRAL